MNFDVLDALLIFNPNNLDDCNYTVQQCVKHENSNASPVAFNLVIDKSGGFTYHVVPQELYDVPLCQIKHQSANNNGEHFCLPEKAK